MALAKGQMRLSIQCYFAGETVVVEITAKVLIKSIEGDGVDQVHQVHSETGQEFQKYKATRKATRETVSTALRTKFLKSTLKLRKLRRQNVL